MTTYGKAIADWVGSLKDGRPYYLVVTDTEGRMSFTNSYFYRSFQAAQAPAIRNSFFNLVHENDRQQLIETLSRCSLRNEAVNTEFRVKNGHFRWVKWELSGIRKPENMAEKFLCLGFEMSNEEQRKKTMQAFEQNYQTGDALFHSFMDHTASFAWIVDEDGKLMFANSPWLSYFQLDESAFGKELSSIIPVEIADILAEKHNIVLQCNRQDRSIIRSLMPDASGYGYQVTVFPIRGVAPCIIVGGEAIPLK
jgi:PAS domain S-box-containing protein